MPGGIDATTRRTGRDRLFQTFGFGVRSGGQWIVSGRNTPLPMAKPALNHEQLKLARARKQSLPRGAFSPSCSACSPEWCQQPPI